MLQISMRQRIRQRQHQVLMIHLKLGVVPAVVVIQGKAGFAQAPFKAEGTDQQSDARHQKKSKKNTRREPRCLAEGLVQTGVKIRYRGLAHSDNTFNLLSCQTLDQAIVYINFLLYLLVQQFCLIHQHHRYLCILKT